MTDQPETNTHRPEHGDDDLDAAAIATVILSGTAIFLLLLLAVRAFVSASAVAQATDKVVNPDYQRLVDHRIEQRLLLDEYGVNPDGKSGRIPIARAMAAVVERYGPTSAPGNPIDTGGGSQ